eukprot:16441588-Heterocapsa_arctica.AAC.1
MLLFLLPVRAGWGDATKSLQPASWGGLGLGQVCNRVGEERMERMGRGRSEAGERRGGRGEIQAGMTGELGPGQGTVWGVDMQTRVWQIKQPLN